MYPGEPCTDISTGKEQSGEARRREKREKGKCRVRVEPVACFIMQKLSRLLDTRSVLCIALYHYNLQPTTNSSTSTLALALEQRRGGGKSLRPESPSSPLSSGAPAGCALFSVQRGNCFFPHGTLALDDDSQYALFHKLSAHSPPLVDARYPSAPQPPTGSFSINFNLITPSTFTLYYL
ncbi:hypothetical protein KQX54_007701 [Cotesia glomerata]|uniref:Uncharacterized protein n=1 Tax=Cotesia glomerata TaxID=32391 RepID=A0AAV7I119_COTGL|nr:hypothetical protein KQX54_007701 [Cotesia glomerata]